MIADENFDRRTSREGHGEGTVVKITVEKYTKPVQSDDYLGEVFGGFEGWFYAVRYRVSPSLGEFFRSFCHSLAAGAPSSRNP